MWPRTRSSLSRSRRPTRASSRCSFSTPRAAGTRAPRTSSSREPFAVTRATARPAWRWIALVVLSAACAGAGADLPDYTGLPKWASRAIPEARGDVRVLPDGRRVALRYRGWTTRDFDRSRTYAYDDVRPEPSVQRVMMPDGVTGDPAKGRALFLDRTKGPCTGCHLVPGDDVWPAGSVGPDQSTIGVRRLSRRWDRQSDAGRRDAVPEVRHGVPAGDEHRGFPHGARAGDDGPGDTGRVGRQSQPDDAGQAGVERDARERRDVERRGSSGAGARQGDVRKARGRPHPRVHRLPCARRGCRQVPGRPPPRRRHRRPDQELSRLAHGPQRGVGHAQALPVVHDAARDEYARGGLHRVRGAGALPDDLRQR